jgi:hypothetical protein
MTRILPASRTRNFARKHLPLVAVLCAAFAFSQTATKTAPPQPVPFSHKVHAGTLKLPCKTCHTNPDPGEMMTIVAASKCMPCHSTIKADSPAIQKLAAFAKENRELKWTRVYQIPGYVFFSHRAHLDAGSTCEECHGPVNTRDQLFRETDISMGGCMNCHRANKASLDCTYCHEQRN